LEFPSREQQLRKAIHQMIDTIEQPGISHNSLFLTTLVQSKYNRDQVNCPQWKYANYTYSWVISCMRLYQNDLKKKFR